MALPHPAALRSAAPPPARPLSSRDRLIMEIAGLGPDPRLHLGTLLTFPGRAPGPDRLAEHLRERLPALPELTLRPDARRRRWEPAPAFDVRDHVHALTVPGDLLADPATALDAVLDQPLDHTRPLWGLWIVGSATADGFALAYRAHHAFQDGRAVTETVDLLLGPPSGRTPGRAPGRPAGTAAPAPRAPRGSALAAALREDLLPRQRHRPTDWPPARQPAAGARRAVLGTYDLGRLHALTRRTGAGTSHLTLAVLTGALRAWHPDTWRDAPAPLPATFALSVRAPDDPYRLLGNRGAVAVLPLPCQQPSPAARLESLRAEASAARLADLARRHSALFDRLPHWCARKGLKRTIDARRVPLALADVRLRADPTWQGTPARHVHLIPPSVPGQPLFAAWTTHRRQLRLTFLADTALPGLDALPGHFDRALTELDAATAP
ncbi:wax ester/triacylglycerol synthase family O-acyltransferase [Kitasatospora saccharophila]|uniref:Wax ester/triacylglycerol synthase family O-acyltransferase n=1 Tax=Kitasatospora saccharophila TaxID=407973 RepID=A0ABN2WE72_9ACTN